MDFGDAGFTSFEGSVDWIKCFQQYPQIDPMNPEPGWYVGKIHSHHNMNVFHSVTDNTDLEQNAPKLPIFLSLIVNYKCELDCKLAIAMESKEIVLTRTEWKFKSWKTWKKAVKKEEKQKPGVFTIACKTTYEQEDWFVDQTEQLAARKKTSQYSYKPPQQESTNKVLLPHEGDAATDVSQETMKRVLNNFPELVSLNCLKLVTPLESITVVDRDLKVEDMENYKKAFKAYFTSVWFDKHFSDTKIEHTEVLDGIRKFLNHHHGWLVGHLKNLTNELREEYDSLWPFQGSSVVRADL